MVTYASGSSASCCRAVGVCRDPATPKQSSHPHRDYLCLPVHKSTHTFSHQPIKINQQSKICFSIVKWSCETMTTRKIEVEVQVSTVPKARNTPNNVLKEAQWFCWCSDIFFGPDLMLFSVTSSFFSLAKEMIIRLIKLLFGKINLTGHTLNK